MLRIITALLLGLISSSAQAKEPTNTVTLPSFPNPTMAAIMVIGGKDATICDRGLLPQPRQQMIPVLDDHGRPKGFLCTGAGRPGATLKFPAGAHEVHIEVGTFKMIWKVPTKDRSEPPLCQQARRYGWDACQTWMNTEFRKQAKAFTRCKQGKGKCPSQPPLRMEDCPCRR